MRKKLYKLDSDVYEHNFDKKALKTLVNTPGLEFLVKKFWEYGMEKYLTVSNTGSYLKATKTNFPDLYEIFTDCCETIDLKSKPDLYIMYDYGINAYTTGVNKPIVVISSGCVDLLTENELRFVIGHELGHIKSDHVLYHQMGNIIPMIGTLVANATFGLGEIFSKSLQYALLHWKRMSEYTSDRAGLLVCQDYRSACSAMMKTAGLPQKYYSNDLTDEFIKQAKEFEDLDYDSLNKAVKILLTLNNTHPWIVLRAHELNKWQENGKYSEIVEIYSKNKLDTTNLGYLYCQNCGAKIKETYLYCEKCGEKLI